ncbi:unnamed protein product [Echinostoma caproni]|uniref:Endo/exonuclease/phosphatase domain-containing protein n=1 Tax=Echinostoma caproni TaxID=27848 RepID=A0A183AMK4_9TREM|nr:unnamed protein product [Echinostoma caproni]
MLHAEKPSKDDNYNQVQEVVNRIPRHDILLTEGDWNARTGPSDEHTRHVLGKFGLGQRYKNIERLVT